MEQSRQKKIIEILELFSYAWSFFTKPAFARNKIALNNLRYKIYVFEVLLFHGFYVGMTQKHLFLYLLKAIIHLLIDSKALYDTSV